MKSQKTYLFYDIKKTLDKYLDQVYQFAAPQADETLSKRIS